MRRSWVSWPTSTVNAFTALNTALLQDDGVVVRIPDHTIVETADPRLLFVSTPE